MRLENVLKRSLQDVFKRSWRCLEDVLKASWRRFEDVLKTFLQDILKMSWRRFKNVRPRRLCLSWSRRLLKTYEWGEYIRLDQDVLKTSSEDEDGRCLHQDECLLGGRINFPRKHRPFNSIQLLNIFQSIVRCFPNLWISEKSLPNRYLFVQSQQWN